MEPWLGCMRYRDSMDPRLYKAAKSGDVDSLKQLVNENPGLLLKVTPHENTALHLAVRLGHKDFVIEAYRGCHVLLTQANLNGDTPLHIAARSGYFSIVSFLVAQIIATSSPKDVENGSEEALEILRWGNNNTALHEAHSLEQNHNLAKNRHHGRTPLHYAASLGDRKMVRRLLQSDAYSIAYLLDKDGLSPLHIAAEKGHTGVIKELIQFCPDSGELLDLSGRNALHVAVTSGKVSVVRYALETTELEGLINQSDNDGNTPLHLATTGHRSWMVRYFTWDKRVDQRAMNKNGQTAIDIDESVRDSSSTLSKVSTPSIWRQLSLPRKWSIREKNNTPSAKQEEEEVATMRTYKQMGHTLLMVATLIATVTFAAAFTMPGGYINNAGPDQGLAALSSSKHLEWFMISDSIAMACSITAACLIFWGAVSGKDSYVYYFASATVLTYIALQATAIAFSTGVVAVLPDRPFVDTMGFIVGIVFHNWKLSVVRYVTKTIEFDGLINQMNNDGTTPFNLATMDQQSWIMRYFLRNRRVEKKKS
ncbi:hypothetical protein HHK36_003215 [Tetracentron sinense]|uniref:PGG domain-containing protein n=1 Tax=Tetracentron sinense TaxID=13715 RepID=A0A834ZQR8_TETSI|nr:hypothetical protein HHK36_003215 [Tetracentron sinense]